MVGSLEISESNRLYDIKYAPYADEYLGKAHGDGYQHMKRWLKKRFIFCDTLYDYAPSYNNDVLTIRANTLNEMNLTIETYTPLYQHVSFYNGNMEKIKITPGQPVTFSGFAQTETDQEVLIYGGSNIKKITGIQSMNPNSMLIGGATRLTELDISNCPILTIVNSNKANFSPHTYLNKLNMSNCPQLGGNLNVSNSPLLQEIKARNSAVTGLLLPTSLRNLKTLELPNTISSLALYDASSLDTLKFDEGVEMQSIELSNCTGITNTENFDLTKTPTVILDNSYNTDELYMSETTNLTLRNMSNLERVIYTPNSEYSEFDINNVINGKSYKVTTNGCPKLKTFMTTAPHRLSYNNSDVVYIEVVPAPTPTYMLNAPVTFNGTSDYIDTGIQLFNTAKDFSLYIDFSSDVTGQANNSAVFHCMHEVSPYRGLAIAVSDNTYFLGGQATINAPYISNMKQGKYLINFKEGVLHSVKQVVDGVITNVTLTNTDSTYAQINQTILLGCYQDSSGNKGRYWNGTINDFGVWIDKTITDEELFGFINKNFEGNIIRKDYGDITPNTSFTANTLDLSATQFTDIKLLCTTDVYNLKVPTTMKNFYCDSAMDIDTDVIEDASYEVIHEELIEPYTTNYEGEVKLVETGEFKNVVISDFTPGGYLHGVNGGVVADENCKYTDYYIEVVPGSHFECPTVRSFIQYDENHVICYASAAGRWLQSNTKYVRIAVENSVESITVSYEGVLRRTPNIIPSSANGSLIFNMYSNNTTQPTSTSPYMWDLTGLKLEDFYTYGMNNWVKPSDDSYATIDTTPRYRVVGFRYNGVNGDNLSLSIFDDFISVSPILIPSDVTSITVTTSDSSRVCYFWSTDYSSATNTFTTASWNSLYKDSGTTWSMQEEKRVFMLSIQSLTTEWFEIAMDNGITIRYYLADMQDLTNSMSSNGLISTSVFYWDSMNISHKFIGATSVTMPQRMPGYSVRLVNADITPDEYPTMLYPKLIDTTLPITGKLDYTKYNGTSLAWAYAYTTGDVDISPVDSRSIGQIEFDYNKLYGTDFVDVVDVWIYKDTDTSKLSTNEAITKAYIELTSDNYKTRVDEVLQWYPNCTDIYFFDDGNVTALNNMITASSNSSTKNQIVRIEFMSGYFDKVTNMNWSINACGNLEEVVNYPQNVTQMNTAFGDCGKLHTVPAIPSSVKVLTTCYKNTKITTAPAIPSGVTSLENTFYGCTALTTPPTIPSSVTTIKNCFYNCTSLTTPPVISQGVTNIGYAFYNCTSLTTAPTIPSSVTNMYATFQNCTKLTQAPVIPSNVTTMQSTFHGCTSLTTAPTIPQGVTDMTAAFQGCTALTTAPAIPSSVTDMTDTFRGCTSLTIGATFEGTACKIGQLYRGCTNLISCSLPLGGKEYLNSYIDCVWNCTALTSITWLGEINISFQDHYLVHGNLPIETIKQAISDLIPEHLATTTATATMRDYMSYLTEDEIAQAVAKGWTLQ